MIKRVKALAIVKNLIKNIKTYGYEIVLDNKIICGNGYCDDYNDTKKQIHIGIKEISDITKIHISEEYLVRILINIFHEIKHAKQQYDF